LKTVGCTLQWKWMLVSTKELIDQLPCCANLPNGPIGDTKKLTQDVMSLLYMNVWLTSTSADANVNRRRCRQLFVHIMFLFYSTVWHQTHLLSIRVPFANLGLIHTVKLLTVCRGGKQNEFTVK
jgi:hypothetical protein